MKTSFKIMLLSASLGVATLASGQDVIRFYQAGKVGYKNKSTGEIVVQPNYTAGSEMMPDRTALVLEGRKRGFINNRR